MVSKQALFCNHFSKRLRSRLNTFASVLYKLAAVLKPFSVDFVANKVLVEVVALSVTTSLSVLMVRLCQSVCHLEVLLYCQLNS